MMKILRELVLTLVMQLTLEYTDVVTDSFQAVGLMIRGCLRRKGFIRHVGIDANYWTILIWCRNSWVYCHYILKIVYYRGCRRGIDVNGLDANQFAYQYRRLCL